MKRPRRLERKKQLGAVAAVTFLMFSDFLLICVRVLQPSLNMVPLIGYHGLGNEVQIDHMCMDPYKEHYNLRVFCRNEAFSRDFFKGPGKLWSFNHLGSG